MAAPVRHGRVGPLWGPAHVVPAFFPAHHFLLPAPSLPHDPSQITGAQNAEFVKFSSGALSRAQAKLAEFLALMPREALTAAKQAYEAEAAALAADSAE